MAFLEEAFGLEMQSNRGSPVIAILSDREGFTLVLQRRKNDAGTMVYGRTEDGIAVEVRCRRALSTLSSRLCDDKGVTTRALATRPRHSGHPYGSSQSPLELERTAAFPRVSVAPRLLA